jgi:glycerol-3-phosphate dehydrogenase (NAD(P)+)
VPSSFVQTVAKQAGTHIQKKAICVDMSKGLDYSNQKHSLTSDILRKVLQDKKVAILSGPAVASQMAMGEFTAMNVVSKDLRVIARLQTVLENNHVRLMPSSDYVGVEISGAFKNVYAILIGICDGLGIAANTKALLFTMALQEIGLLVKHMGGNPKTVYGLAGLGDFFTTAISTTGRNRRFGEWVGKGFKIPEAKKQVGQIVEGILAAQALYMISKKYKVRLLLGDVVYKILYKGSDPKKELAIYLSRVR